MLIYQVWHKSSGASTNRGSPSPDFEQLSPVLAHNNNNNNKKQFEGRKTSSAVKTTTILTRANTNFLRSLGYRVRQYRKLKNE